MSLTVIMVMMLIFYLIIFSTLIFDYFIQASNKKFNTKTN